VSDGFALEIFGEDVFGLGQVIKPRENFAAKLAVVEASVQFFADVGGEAGDFA